MAENRNRIVLRLPLQVAANDLDLQPLAARIFRASRVRSVTVDHGRTVAVVQLRSGSSAEGSTIEETSRLLADTVALPVGTEAPATELLSWVNPNDRSISFIEMRERVSGWRRVWYLSLAGVALSLALLGIVLPGLPTTPFVLLASYCLLRSSTRLHERLMASRVFGGVLRDWYVHRGLRPHVRARAVAVVAIVVALSLLVAWPPWPVVLAIVALAACGLAVIWRLPSIKE